MMKVFNFRLDDRTEADLLAMAQYVGKPGNYTAGLCGLIQDWRRLKAEHEARLSRAAELARHEEYLDAMEQHEEATA